MLQTSGYCHSSTITIIRKTTLVRLFNENQKKMDCNSVIIQPIRLAATVLKFLHISERVCDEKNQQLDCFVDIRYDILFQTSSYLKIAASFVWHHNIFIYYEKIKCKIAYPNCLSECFLNNIVVFNVQIRSASQF